jgi:3'-phosphoadenosine 5'-phosphosulfate sulfotransferase (PAPS reductase)/FAD synthetase
MDTHATEVAVRNQAWVRAAVTARFEQWFMPTPLTDAEAAALRRAYPDLPVWIGRTGRALAFEPPPPTLAIDPDARPRRLGQANARLKELRALGAAGKAALARRVVTAMLDCTDRPAVAFSGGRDSLVTLHLVLEQRPDVEVVFTNTGIEFPETLAYVRRLAADWNLNFRELRPRRNFWELARERGLPVGGRGNGFFLKEIAQAANVKLSNACCNQLKITPARQHYRQTGIEAVATGLRADESLIRRLNLADYGALRYSKDYGAVVAWPLFAWSSADVAAYIARHALPVNPLYAMGHQRVGCWSCLQDFFHPDSRLFVLKKTHPGMYASLKKQFGNALLRVLLAWGHVAPRNLDAAIHFDGLYRPCGLELLNPRARGRRTERSTVPGPGEVPFAEAPAADD